MPSISFTKMHGLGNSYIYIDLFKETMKEEDMAKLAIKMANPNTGIGSDGMILICPSDVAPVKMRIFNSDGSEGKTCGNGLRCVAKYAYEQGLVTEQTFQIETLAGIVDAVVYPDGKRVTQVQINMGQPIFKRQLIPMSGEGNEPVINESIVREGMAFDFTAVSMGNPHIVTFVEDIEKAPVCTLGPILEKDSLFPEGVNVEFIERVSDQELHFRVWERGSGVTQACGSGACAATVAAIMNHQAARGEDVLVHLLGGDLTINWTENGDVLMTGPCETVATGSFYY